MSQTSVAVPSPSLDAAAPQSLEKRLVRGSVWALVGHGGSQVKVSWATETDAPMCHECGSMMVRSGACHKCLNCGATSGCS